MQQSRTLSGGLDVHKEAIAVAAVAQEHHAEGVSLGTIGPRPCAIETLVRQLPSTRQPLGFGSAAGPGGSWLDRSLTQKGQVGAGIAPSLRPTKPRDRVTTNRRDALTLARLRRAGALTPVDVPQGEAAARRDLCLARADTIRARKAAQFQRTAFLLRHEMRSTGRAPWSPAHLRFLQ
jgi:transposase